MHIETAENCPTCKGSGKVQPPILFPELVKDELTAMLKEQPVSKLELHLHPFVAAYMKKGFGAEERKLRRELGCKLKVVSKDSLHFMEYRVYGPDGTELQRRRR